MKRIDLLNKCKDNGITGVSSKNKSELLAILEKHDVLCVKEHHEYTRNDIFDGVLKQLLSKTPKDKRYKVCKNCNDVGHYASSIECKLNIDKNNILTRKIKNFIMTRDCLTDTTIDDYCIELSNLLDITPNVCKTLYNAIPAEDFVYREMDIVNYLRTITDNMTKCNNCQANLVYIQANTHRQWKGSQVCDICWGKYADIRDFMWRQIKEYKQIKCEMCDVIQIYNTQRFHYDHINMFNKGNSICSMVNDGTPIEEIYNEIDKCQIMCLSCHHIVTDIERKLNFTRIKQNITRKLNMNEITQEDYDLMSVRYQAIYEIKMLEIYEAMRKYMADLSLGIK